MKIDNNLRDKLEPYIYFETDLGILLNGDCSEVMPLFEDDYFDLCVTSPPYDNLRDYEEYNFDFEGIANNLHKTCKEGGVVVWVVGDQVINGSESGTSFKQALYFKEIGFNLHDTMIYEKVSFSNPDKSRYHQVFEYMFVFSKGRPETFNPISDRKNRYANTKCFGKNTTREKNGNMKYLGGEDRKINKWGKRFNIWRLKTASQENICQQLPHPAMFPKKLAKDHIISWSNKNDLIIDPFIGSGTTAVACEKLNRRWVGVEISETYCKIASKRISQESSQLKMDI